MASKAGTRRKRTPPLDGGRLTEPRYLFPRDGESLARLAEAGLAECRTRLDELVSTAGPRTISNLLVPYDRLLLALGEVLYQTRFLFDVHPDPDVRNAADRWYQEAQRFATELSLNRPLYEAFAALNVSSEDDETRYAIEKIVRDFRLAGVDRDEATRGRIQALRDETTAIGQEFDRIIREDVRSITVDSRRDLEGLPDDFIEGHAPGPDGKITVTTNYPDSIPVFRYARNAEVRRRLLFEYLNRGHPANLDVLARLLAKRHELASVLGYDSWAEYIVQDKMVRSAKAVAQFLGKVTTASAERAQEDYARLLERKRHDVPAAAALDAWDPNYYSEVVRAESFAFDAKLLRPYFAFPRVRDGLFALTGELFGVRYERVPGVPVWHASVEVYDVYDGARQLGRFYLDLHPRKDKYTHAAASGLVTGIRGTQLPQAALMCNFPDPSEGPALMDYREVETFFHEFGHLLHSIFQGYGRWVKNTAEGLEGDFIEAPSQMLEEWVRDPEALRRFALHHETGEPVPAEFVAKLKRADAVSRALDAQRQLVYATLSLEYYRSDPTPHDTTRTLEEVFRRFPLVPFFPETHFQCSFGHLNDYSAIYYTYMWSLVIAKDLFSKFREGGSILDPAIARRYRETILARGSAKPAARLVEDFLGRPLSFDAFEAWLQESA
ncbi:MAG TPA: M3 family metallopeptidase [Thermoplasmata archaeon]